MFGRNSTKLAVYIFIKIKHVDDLCRGLAAWLVKDSSVRCVVEGGKLSPNYAQSLDGEKEEKVSGKDLP